MKKFDYTLKKNIPLSFPYVKFRLYTVFIFVRKNYFFNYLNKIYLGVKIDIYAIKFY